MLDGVPAPPAPPSGSTARSVLTAPPARGRLAIDPGKLELVQNSVSAPTASDVGRSCAVASVVTAPPATGAIAIVPPLYELQ